MHNHLPITVGNLAAVQVIIPPNIFDTLPNPFIFIKLAAFLLLTPLLQYTK